MKILLVVVLLIFLSKGAHTQVPKKAEAVTVNGTTVYYEVYGKGTPLFLLHGYTQSSKYWHAYLPAFTDDYEVYIIDLKGHGKSGINIEPLSITAAAQDVLALTAYLELDSVNAIGYSYGGNVLLQIALLRPQLVKNLISIGACGTWVATAYPELVNYLSYKTEKHSPGCPTTN